MEDNQLYGATLDRVYRLALLAAGSPRAAARLTSAAYARRAQAPQADPPAHDAELALARSLLDTRPGPWRWRPDPQAAAYTGLAPAALAALRATFAAATPAARLALGAPHLVGIDITPGGLLQPAPPDAPWPRRADDPHTLLALLARAWGLLPTDAGFADVHEQALLLAGALSQAHADELRALLLAHSPAAEHSRAIREGLRRASARLAAAMPALFGGEAPAALRERLRGGAPPPRRPRPIGRHARLQLALVAAVIVVILATLFLPGARSGAMVSEPGLAQATSTGWMRPTFQPAALLRRAPAGCSMHGELSQERTMQTNSPEPLAARCAELSSAHQGYAATIERLDAADGAELLTCGAPFDGLRLEGEGAQLRLLIMAGGRVCAAIDRPEQLTLSPAGYGQLLLIAADGQPAAGVSLAAPASGRDRGGRGLRERSVG